MLLYSTVCTMCIMTIPRCPDRIHRGVTFVRFANSTLITSFLKELPFLLSSFPSQLLALPLSHSLSFLVSLSIAVSLVVLVDCCLLVVCDCPLLMNLVIAFFPTVGASLPYRMHVQYGLHGTVVSVHLRYSTVCTMLTVGASLPYRMRVRAASYDSLRAPVVHYCLYHAGTTIRSRCHIRFFCELNIVHHFLPQTSLSSFLSPSASRSTTVLPPLVPREFEHCCLVDCIATDFY
jgi:hypothetical protein